MKLVKLPVVLFSIFAFIGHFVSAASNAQIVAEDPDGSLVVRSGSAMLLDAGDILRAGDLIQTRTATVVISICDGALVTVYPESEVLVSSLSNELAVLNLVKGELLGDTISGCNISIENKVGTADISNGVYGVLLNQTDEGWTLQVRNLDGDVTFTGGNLDTTNATALLRSGQPIAVPAGEQLTVEGSYDPTSNVFTPAAGSGSLGVIPPFVMNEMEDAAEDMRDKLPDRQGDEGTPTIPNLIEIPYEDIETASDKG